jgi:hypothetical protein
MHHLGLPSSRLRLIDSQAKLTALPAEGTSQPLGSGEVRYHQDQVEVRAGQEPILVNGDRVTQDWTPLPPRGKITLGKLDDPTIGLVVVPEGAPNAHSRPVALTYFGDSSHADIRRGVTQQGAVFQKLLGDSLKFEGVLATGSPARDAWKRSLPWLAAGCAVAAAVGAALAVPVSLGLSAGLFGVAAMAGLVSKGTHKDAQDYAKNAPRLPDMKGLKVVAGSPQIDDLETAWRANLKNWPSATQVVYLSGHGERFEVAGLSWPQIAQTIQGADLVILDACNGAQLETLTQLGDSTKTVLASTHPVRASGLPIERIFGAASFPQEPAELATSMLLAADYRRPAPSLVAVDQEQLQNSLLPSLDRLGKKLSQLPPSVLQDLLTKCERPDSVEGRTTFDLGSFLYQLQTSQTLADSNVEPALKAFQSTILAMSGHGTMSFDLYPAGSKLPDGWLEFCQRARSSN